jgi:hypothetical protein
MERIYISVLYVELAERFAKKFGYEYEIISEDECFGEILIEADIGKVIKDFIHWGMCGGRFAVVNRLKDGSYRISTCDYAE